MPKNKEPKSEASSVPTAEEIRRKQEDLELRGKHFNEEMIPLLKKYNLGLGATAFLLPDGRIAARPQLFDPSDLPKPAGPAEPEKIADGEIPQA